MEEIRLTSWYGKYLIIYMVVYIPGGAGFLPSTVWNSVKPMTSPSPHATPMHKVGTRMRGNTSRKSAVMVFNTNSAPAVRGTSQAAFRAAAFQGWLAGGDAGRFAARSSGGIAFLAGFLRLLSYNHPWAVFKTLMTFHDTNWFIGILILPYEIPQYNWVV